MHRASQSEVNPKPI